MWDAWLQFGAYCECCFWKVHKKPVHPCELAVRDEWKQRGACVQLWGRSALGRPLRFPPLATHSILVPEVTSALEVAQLSDHQLVDAELPLLAAQSTGRWLKEMRRANTAASRRGCPAPSTLCPDTFSLIQPGAQPIQFTQLAENKSRNKWKNK